jgi:hypothetical protein
MDEETDGFNHDVVQLAQNKATAAKALLHAGKIEKASRPTFTSLCLIPISDHRTATSHDDSVSLARTDGRIEADYILLDGGSDTPHSEYHLRRV